MYSLYWLIDRIFTLYYWILLARVIISWLRPNVNYNSIWRHVLRFIYDITEPVLRPIRNIIPAGNLPLDFSPLIAMFLLSIIRRLIIVILFNV